MPPHLIRLRGPWTCRLTTGGAAAETAEAISFQAPHGLASAVPGDFHGCLWLERRFHRPTGLDAGERVALSFTAPVTGQVWLNDVCLGTFPPGTVRCEITAQLRPENRLSIQLDLSARPRELPAWEARLEIATRD